MLKMVLVFKDEYKGKGFSFLAKLFFLKIILNSKY